MHKYLILGGFYIFTNFQLSRLERPSSFQYYKIIISGSPSIFLTFYFEITVDSQEVAKLVQRDLVYPLLSFLNHQVFL